MRIIFGIGILVCISCISSYSQDDYLTLEDISKIKFDHLTIEDGLANSTIKSIIQDDYGFIWIAALNTLCRYDGYEFKTYQHSPKNPNTLSGDRITALAETSNGKILVGTWQKGLDLFDPITENVVHYRYIPEDKSSLGSNQVNDIYIDKNDGIWIGAGSTLNHFEPEKEKFTTYGLNQQNLLVNSIVEYNNEIWIITNQLRLFRLDTVQKSLEPLELLPENHHDPLIWRCKLYTDSKENLWICAAKKGLYRYDLKSKKLDYFQHLPSDPYSVSNNDVFDIVEAEDGAYWIATDGGGLNYFDFNKKQFYKIVHSSSDNNSLSNNKPHILLKDKTQILWIGMYNGGVNIYDPNKIKFQSYCHNPNDLKSLSNNIVWTFLEEENGDILIGTDRGGINIFNPENTGNDLKPFLYNPENPSDIPSSSCITLYNDKSGIIWIGTYNDGLIRYDKARNTYKTYKAIENKPNNTNSPSGNDVWDIIEDNKGNLWLATLRYGVDVLNPSTNTFTHYNTSNSNLSSNEVTTLFMDSKNRIWIGTADGLCLFNQESNNFEVFRHIDQNMESIPGDNIRTFFEDINHNIWIGTEGAGLCMMDIETFKCTNYAEENGLPSNVIYGILQDDNGKLWISTSRGLSSFDIQTKKIRNYTDKEGLQSNEFKQNACLKLKNGRMLFGGIGGFSIFHPDELKENANVPAVYITEFTKIGKSKNKDGIENLGLMVNTKDKIEINPKNKIIIIKYTALNYTIPEKNQYEYMMEGFDDDWHKAGNRREATYTNLNPGKYTFRVRASNNDDVWNNTGASIDIEILSPWYKTYLFKIAVILIILGLIGLYNYIRIKIIKKQKEELEKQVDLRTRELQLANFELQHKQDEITTINEEISQQNEEILTQRDEIEKKSIQLENSYNRIKAFNKFGQEISTILDISAIYRMIYNYVSSLIDTSIFGIGIYNEKKNLIAFEYFVEEGKDIPPFTSKMDDSTSNAVWCFKNQKHLICNDFKNEYKNYISTIKIKTSKIPESLIYLPLTVQEKKIGVLTIQSYKKNAYSDNDLQTLQTLTSYFAIALDNANAYEIVKKQNIELETHRTELASLVMERTKDLEAAKLKAEESDRLKSAFLANMSHEIRTPLNAIVGFAEILSSENFEVVSKQEIIKIIEHNSSSLLNIINDIIDFSKIEAGEISINFNDVNPTPLLQEVFFIYKETLKKQGKDKDIKLILNEDSIENAPIINTDLIRLRQILCNLLDNAIKYTNKGIVEFGYKGVDDNKITFYVKDSGIGIKPENFEIIFKRFSKIEGENIFYRGTGLGLTITKYLIECLGGKIWLTSEFGKGSVFFFNLPIKSNEKKEIPAEKKLSTKSAIPDWSSKTILIAEDEVSNYKLLESYLKQSGINILWAKNGTDAVKLFLKNKSISLILMDIKMPGKDGIDAANEIKTIANTIPIIAQTAYALPEEEYRIRSLDFDEYIAKPIHQETLITLLLKFLD